MHTILALRTQMTLAKLRGQRETNQALVLPRADHVQRVLNIRWIRGFELHQLARGRVQETEADGVQARTGSAPYIGSPTQGCRMAAMCTRI